MHRPAYPAAAPALSAAVRTIAKTTLRSASESQGHAQTTIPKSGGSVPVSS